MKYFILLLLLFLFSPVYAQNTCSSYIGSCDYYLCKNTELKCDGDSYFIKLGYQYCTKSFSKLYPKVSEQGKAWVVNTARCLQQKLEDMGPALECENAEKLAANAHVACYVDNGFCDLPFTDRMRILNLIKKEIYRPSTLKEFFEVSRECVHKSH